ncbi:MAG: ATP-binding cassette domain-containing protein, partial [Acetobacteraceae bacterium]
MMEAAPLLRCRCLCRRFGGIAALTELDLEVVAGAIHSIIGPNGAGKTTVFNCITQNLSPTSGEVWFQ